jgi:hypothetical protein
MTPYPWPRRLRSKPLLTPIAMACTFSPRLPPTSSRRRVRGQTRIKKSREKNPRVSDWGDPLEPRPADHSQIAFCNIQGFPVDPKHYKHQQIHQCIKKYQLNLFGIIEVNLNFKLLGPKARWHDRFSHAPNHHSSVAWKEHVFSKSRWNFGGVANILDTDFTHRVNESGNDPSGLGRWTWTTFRGVRIITGYRPCVDYSDSDKPNSVYSQHERHFATKKDGRDPRQAFFEDLDHDMLVWLASGDLIALGLDANEHVRRDTTVKFINKWGLVDVHADQHSHLPPVATQDTNQNSIPVDKLWCSPGLPITAASMTGFGEIQINNADHRMLWVDLPNDFLFGFCPPPLPTITPNRLNLRNPKVIARYNKIQKRRNADIWYQRRFNTFLPALSKGYSMNKTPHYMNPPLGKTLLPGAMPRLNAVPSIWVRLPSQMYSI